MVMACSKIIWRGQLGIERQHQALDAHAAFAQDFNDDLFEQLKGQVLAEERVSAGRGCATCAGPKLQPALAVWIAQPLLLLGFDQPFRASLLWGIRPTQDRFTPHDRPDAGGQDRILRAGPDWLSEPSEEVGAIIGWVK